LAKPKVIKLFKILKCSVLQLL